eukprot:CAMPEP_0205815778 /NCGR_PEP_ID=MMETSP0205-20121125/21725_1 /ASSEMBLY_ACC=CAM_ASM_000278 /TAXON_ID=36767 /ORGANISM="Euplotes focardii, Strain TN1" /LENGTH=44 /DNA_ID= /DNA_START= /DNA_END= /DNA_ORIENTATION=
MKTLSAFTKEELKQCNPLKVTYIATKKAKIVKYDCDISTASESE